jgi:hypothetical protein
MPFGVYAGKTLAELAQSERGREYLGWIANHAHGNPGNAARIVLKQTREVLHGINEHGRSW